jgi:RNA polymerase sigma factor (sigma-70 family)
MMVAQSMEDDGTADLFTRMNAGDQGAWKFLFEKCYPKVIRVVRRKLTSSAMRSLYDSADFASDVWKSVAASWDRYQFPNVDAFEAFLMKAVEQKVIDEYRRQHTLKHAITHKCSLDGLHPVQREIPSSEPTPSQVAQGRERFHLMMKGLTQTQQQVLEMRCAGYSTEVIAEKVGWNLRTVQRFLKSLKDSHIE